MLGQYFILLKRLKYIFLNPGLVGKFTNLVPDSSKFLNYIVDKVVPERYL